MTAKSRILAIRISEKIKRNPEFAANKGISVKTKELPLKNKTNKTKNERKNIS